MALNEHHTSKKAKLSQMNSWGCPKKEMVHLLGIERNSLMIQFKMPTLQKDTEIMFLHIRNTTRIISTYYLMFRYAYKKYFVTIAKTTIHVIF